MKSAEQIISEIKNLIVTKMHEVNDPDAVKILSECLDELRAMQKEIKNDEGAILPVSRGDDEKDDGDHQS